MAWVSGVMRTRQECEKHRACALKKASCQMAKVGRAVTLSIKGMSPEVFCSRRGLQPCSCMLCGNMRWSVSNLKSWKVAVNWVCVCVGGGGFICIHSSWRLVFPFVWTWSLKGSIKMRPVHMRKLTLSTLHLKICPWRNCNYYNQGHII